MTNLNQYTLIKGLKASLSISIVVSTILLVRTVDFNLIKQFQKIQPTYLMLSLFLVLLIWFIQGIRIQILAQALEERVSVIDGIKVYLASTFVSNITPFGSGGSPVQTYLLHQLGMSLGKATSIITIQWVMRYLFFGFFGPIFFFFYRDIIDPGNIPESIFTTAVYVSIFITSFLVFFILKPQILRIVATFCINLPFIKSFLDKSSYSKKIDYLVQKIFNEIDIFHNSLKIIVAKRKAQIFIVLIFTFLFWFLFFMILPLLLMGLGERPFFMRSFIMQTILFLVLPYIPTPGGSGAIELGFVAFFSTYIPFNLVGVVLIIWRFLTYYIYIFVGSIVTLHMLN